MSRKLDQNKLFKFFKIAASEPLLSAWIKSHPPRYSDSESGLNSWIEDVKKSLGITEEAELKNILEGNIDPSILPKASGWSDVSSLFPSGEKIRKRWQKSSGNKDLSGFISWLSHLGKRDSSSILDSIVPQGADSIKQEVSKPISKEREIKGVVDPGYTPDEEFYKKILIGIGAPVTPNNLAYLYAWRQAEGGKAAFNPFNTTQPADGATNYNKVGVKNYTSAEQGVEATVKTISNGRYESIIGALKRDRPPMETAEALIASPWGTSSLIKRVISGYEAGSSPKPHPISQSAEKIA